jgi:hypothetical protein
MEKVEGLVMRDPVLAYLFTLIINGELGNKAKGGHHCAR